ncbi:hypothetical protein FSP39_001519 [Pinctada imbricata]|uniref:MD-2-related lipid-recognition domain-containing protein n=1 Tax=Pinctada imbricata TaxID=66713 RepID=A0AA88Y6B0_PINIB|nr:hypothetical protein FSP39_001519 [Pinctada imbricata]
MLQGQDHSTRLLGFNWKDCGNSSNSIAHVTSLSISPDPLELTGNINLKVTGNIVSTLSQNLTGFNKGKGSEKPKLKAFKYENCGGVETITDLVLSPDPLQFPGEIDLTIDGTLSKTLEANLSASLNMTKKIAGIPIHLPCVDGIGSCNYTDLCGMLAQIPECPPELVAQGIDCKCPLKKVRKMVSSKAELNFCSSKFEVHDCFICFLAHHAHLSKA